MKQYLVPQDILRLGPEVMEELHRVFRFEKATCWFPSREGEFPEVEMSPRQMERAERALLEGRPFWDLVGASVLLPMPDKLLEHPRIGKKLPLGAFLLKGVDHSVGADEPERWLALLESWVWERVLEKRKSYFYVPHEGIIPQYISRVISINAQMKQASCVLHLGFKHARCLSDYDRLIASIKKYLNALFKKQDVCLELCGVSPAELWCVLTGFEDAGELDSVLARLSALRQVQGLGLESAVLCHVEYAGPEKFHQSMPDAGKTDSDDPDSNKFDCQREMARLESILSISDILGMPLFSDKRFRDIEIRFGLSGTGEVLVSAASQKLPRSFVAAFTFFPSALLESANSQESTCKSPSDNKNNDYFDEVHTSENSNCAIFIKKVPFRARDSFDLSGWGRAIQYYIQVKEHLDKKDAENKKYPVGIAASWQQTLKGDMVPGASFWAFVHASMLDTGDAVAFDHTTWQVRGDELLTAGSMRHACSAYRKAIRLQPRNAELYNSLGVALVQRGRRKEAESAFLKASQLDPDDFMAFYNLCGIQHALGQLEDAETSCSRALEIRPGDPAALVRLGAVLVDSGKPDDAAACLEKALEQGEKPLPAVWRLLGIVYYSQGRWSQAKRFFEKTLKVLPGDTLSRAWLALGYVEHERDISTARRLGAGLVSGSKAGSGARDSGASKMPGSLSVHAVLSRLSALIAQSSLDKEKTGG